MTDQPRLDAAALAELQDVMEDEFDTLIQTFLADSQARIAGLEQALAQKNAGQLAKTAHSFKGSCINIGAPWLSELCSRLEHAGKSGDLETAATVLERVVVEFAEVARRLSQF